MDPASLITSLYFLNVMLPLLPLVFCTLVPMATLAQLHLPHASCANSISLGFIVVLIPHAMGYLKLWQHKQWLAWLEQMLSYIWLLGQAALSSRCSNSPICLSDCDKT